VRDEAARRHLDDGHTRRRVELGVVADEGVAAVDRERRRGDDLGLAAADRGEGVDARDEGGRIVEDEEVRVGGRRADLEPVPTGTTTLAFRVIGP